MYNMWFSLWVTFSDNTACNNQWRHACVSPKMWINLLFRRRFGRQGKNEKVKTYLNSVSFRSAVFNHSHKENVSRRASCDQWYKPLLSECCNNSYFCFQKVNISSKSGCGTAAGRLRGSCGAAQTRTLPSSWKSTSAVQRAPGNSPIRCLRH